MVPFTNIKLTFRKSSLQNNESLRPPILQTLLQVSNYAQVNGLIDLFPYVFVGLGPTFEIAQYGSVAVIHYQEEDVQTS